MRILMQDADTKLSPQEQAVCDYIWRQAQLRPGQTRVRTAAEYQVLAKMTHRPQAPVRPEPPIWWTSFVDRMVKIVKRTSSNANVADAEPAPNRIAERLRHGHGSIRHPLFEQLQNISIDDPRAEAILVELLVRRFGTNSEVQAATPQE